MTEAWWEEMLVQWIDVPEEQNPAEEENNQPENSDSASTKESQS